MNKPFTAMLAELNINIGNKRFTPTSSTDIDALDDKEDDNVGGMELPASSDEDCDCGVCSTCTGSTTDMGPPVDAQQIGDMEDTKTDLGNLSIDQIIAALQSIKAKQEEPKDLGGEPVEPHSDFADVDPNEPPENLNPADNRMPDDGPIDDDNIPMLPGLRKSAEDEQLLKKPSLDDEDNIDGLNAAKDGQDEFHKDDDNSDPLSLDKDDTSDDLDMDPDGPTDPDSQMDPDQNMDAETPAGETDENHMGSLRTVKGAHLVYKRQAGDGTFTELWTYGIGEHINDAIGVKKAILAGTDIPENKMRSEDGTQMYELVTMGNCQLLQITGLPG